MPQGRLHFRLSTLGYQRYNAYSVATSINRRFMPITWKWHILCYVFPHKSPLNHAIEWSKSSCDCNISSYNLPYFAHKFKQIIDWNARNHFYVSNRLQALLNHYSPTSHFIYFTQRPTLRTLPYLFMLHQKIFLKTKWNTQHPNSKRMSYL